MDPNEMEQLRQIEEMKKKLLTQMLSKEAYERLARVRAVNQELAGRAELYLIQAFQAGGLKQIVTEENLKEVLRALSGKKEMKFRRV